MALYARSLPFGLVGYDDDTYIFDDARLQALSLGSVLRIFTEPYFSNYHPITTLTYALDRALYGEWIPGYRFTHLALYAAGVVLVWALFRRLLGSAGWALVAGALFAAHTLHVEPVAWLAQRKDLVCLIFYTAALLTYSRYARHGGWRPYVLSVAWTGLAMLSKGYAVVLPAVLLAYDACFGARLTRRQLIDKAPFVLIAIAVTLATAAAQESAQLDVAYSLGERLELLFKIFAVYAARALLPIDLSALYVVGRAWLPPAVALVGFLLLAGALAAFLRLRRTQPAVAFGVALYLLPLGTVMNVFFTLRIWIADRYLFFPTIGAALLLAAAARQLTVRRPERARLVAGACAALLLFYAGATVSRIGVWSDSIALWSDVVRKHGDLPGAGALTRAELDAVGRESPEVARRVRGLPASLLNYLAQAYGRSGKESEAQALSSSVAETRRDPVARIRAAIERGDWAGAEQMAAAMAQPGGWDAPAGWELIGAARGQRGALDAARDAYTRALALHEQSGRNAAEVMQNLGLVELQAKNLDAALSWYKRASERQPDDPRSFLGLGATYEAQGRGAEALGAYREGLARQGRTPAGIRFDFGELDLRAGRLAERRGQNAVALEHYRAFLRREPARSDVAASIARLEASGGSP